MICGARRTTLNQKLGTSWSRCNPLGISQESTQSYFRFVHTVNLHSQFRNVYQHGQVRLPPNLSIVATMNTSDDSIFYMDAAFKRRWDWKFKRAPASVADLPPDQQVTIVGPGIAHPISWGDFVIRLNLWICQEYQSVHRVEDKQIGFWFLKATNNQIQLSEISDKLLFFLWDSVFPRNRAPLATLLKMNVKHLVTFASLQAQLIPFVMAINARVLLAQP